MLNLYICTSIANGAAYGCKNVQNKNTQQTCASPSGIRCHTIHTYMRFRIAKLDTGHLRKIKDPEIEEVVLPYFQRSETSSTLSAVNVLSPSFSTVWRVLHENRLHLFYVQRVYIDLKC